MTIKAYDDDDDDATVPLRSPQRMPFRITGGILRTELQPLTDNSEADNPKNRCD